MARGDVVLFREFADQLGREKHLFPADVLKLGIVNNTIVPAVGDTTPIWGDYSINEVSALGGYVSGGLTLTGVTFATVAGVASLKADDIALAQDVVGFTDAFWGIVFNFTEATGMAVGFLDFGGPVSEQSGPVNINWNVGGIFKIVVP